MPLIILTFYITYTAMEDRSMRILSVDKHECVATVCDIHDVPAGSIDLLSI